MFSGHVINEPAKRCRKCGGGLYTQRAVKSGICIVCLEMLLHKVLVQVPLPKNARLIYWRN